MLIPCSPVLTNSNLTLGLASRRPGTFWHRDLLAELLVLLLELQYLVTLVRDRAAASGERVLAVGLIFRRPPSEGAARYVELVAQPLDRDLSLENQSRGGELELPVVAFLNAFPIETLVSPCPLYCPSPVLPVLFWSRISTAVPIGYLINFY